MVAKASAGSRKSADLSADDSKKARKSSVKTKVKVKRKSNDAKRSKAKADLLSKTADSSKSKSADSPKNTSNGSLKSKSKDGSSNKIIRGAKNKTRGRVKNKSLGETKNKTLGETKKKVNANSKNSSNGASNVAASKPSKSQRIATQSGKDQSLPNMEDLKILSIDIGGTKVKMLVNGEVEPRKAMSGKAITPITLVELVKELTKGWKYDAVSIGYPGLIGQNGPISEPHNLGSGWVGFDFSAAFGKPVKLVNDAAMQAIGNYEGGRMLFLGFGTGLGSTLIANNVIIPLELNNLRYNADYSIGEVTGRSALKRLGVKKWRVIVDDLIASLMRAFIADYIVVGGGNAKYVGSMPTGARRGHNQTAFRGGYRIWGLDSIPTHAPDSMKEINDWQLI